ncbi:hypothetical protein F4776DRAFT_668920 [Hypoxylon sp. NC0597]|nr:hypothetical protein F4776DRAFT_668920 [Hypoxylon sp. NC0597]
MDLLDELESMAQVAIRQPAQQEPDNASIKRWQSLFGYSFSQAAQKIEEHRSDLSRDLVTDSHWEMVRLEKEAQGDDKEAYEHFSHAQDEYPVWYFFYGTLGDAAVLKRLLGCEPSYHAASVAREKWSRARHSLSRTGIKRNVSSYYETDKYEVVRCEIRFANGETIKGLSFRFVGDVER